MGLFVEFDVVEDFGYLDATEEYGIVPDYSEGCKVFVETFLKIAEELVPVDTGYLLSTLTAEDDDTYCYAETECDYAQYPEFGTWCQESQPYFSPALEEAIAEAQPYWDRAQEKALEEELRMIEQEQNQALQAQANAAIEDILIDEAEYQAISAQISGIIVPPGGLAPDFTYTAPIIGKFSAEMIIADIQTKMSKNFSFSEEIPSIDKKISPVSVDDIRIDIPEIIIT